MSVIGPRPALWNQDVLTAERDKYGANDVKPGLTGWAQINGRDELEIPVKAKLDGEYVQKERICIKGYRNSKTVYYRKYGFISFKDMHTTILLIFGSGQFMQKGNSIYMK